MRKNAVVNIALTVLATIVVIVTAYFYAMSVNKLLISETQMHLKEVAMQGASQITEKIKANMEVVKALAVDMSDFTEMNHDDIVKTLDRHCKATSFSRLGFADKYGETVTSDNMALSIGKRDYFLKAFSGTPTISNPILDTTGVFGKIVVFATPVYSEENEIVGVLYGLYNIEKIAEMLNVNFFENTGYSYMCHNDGAILVHPKQDVETVNVYDLLNEENDPAISAEMRKKLIKNESGTMRYVIKGEKKYVGYASIPIEGKENWNFISVIPERVAFRYSNSIMLLTALGLIAIAVAFLLIGLYITKSRRKFSKEIANIAFNDSLCGIKNYNGFCKECEKLFIANNSQKYAIIHLDINNFKIINDAYGYEYGNQVLRSIASSIKNVFSGKVIGRISGDYFGICCDYRDRSEVITKVELLINSVKGLSTKQCETPLCIGIYFYESHTRDVATLINKANMARRSVKGVAGSSYAVYDAGIRSSMREEAWIIEAMKEALRNRDFEVYYQPKFDIATFKISGGEALARWNDKEKGFIPPMKFIPIAEKAELVVDIDRFVFEQVCIDVRRWLDDGKKVLPISVNLSRAQLYRKDTVIFMRDTIAKYQIDPALLEIEITETIAASDMENIRRMLLEFKKLGLLISIDDFGSGYSSLSCLQDLPVDIIKLDSSFLSNIMVNSRGRSIVKGIIALSAELKLDVVCEGIETEEQLNLLDSFGCDFGQGFYFARPMNKSEFTVLLK